MNRSTSRIASENTIGGMSASGTRSPVRSPVPTNSTRSVEQRRTGLHWPVSSSTAKWTNSARSAYVGKARLAMPS